MRENWKLVLQWSDAALAAVWCVRTRTLMSRLGEVPDLSDVRWDLCPVSAPGLVIVVPAKDEAETIGPAMETLLAQDYPWLRVVAVDDRSADATGRLLDELAASRPDRLGVVHLTEEAEGWIAKTFAMETAARQSRSDWLLFTDADVWFSPSLLRRALSYAEISRADHLVVIPSPVIRRWHENILIGFLTVFGVWVSRPWRVADPNSARDIAGAGAFNMIRRDAWEELGGFAPQRLAVVEDLTLGQRVRAARLRQRVAFAPGLVLVHWATGLHGLVRGMTKNLFAATGFRLWMSALFCCGIVLLFLAPLLGLAWWGTLLPSLVIVACIGAQYRILGEVTGIAARWALLYPIGGLALLWAMLRSVIVTLWRGGVRWRDTFYPLRDLRPWNSPFRWEFEAARGRAQQRKVQRGLQPSRWLRTMTTMRERLAIKRRVRPSRRNTRKLG
ncbi:MAG TPA: glycosyltransferase family 2 protein [Acidobacteriaceae bacterium]|nr:glycosyltransferase family 2 protein [Acidobacteriaceae bacterium]